MKVTLVLPGNRNYRSSAISQAGAEHLGLGYIAAFIREQGHEVSIVNFQFKDYLSYWEGVDSNRIQPLSTEDMIAEILNHEPDVVGISVTGLTIHDVLEITKGLKKEKPGIHTCWGGHQAYQNAEDILTREHSVDTIVAGDGEITFSRLLETLENGGRVGDITGLWYREKGKIIFSGPAPEPDLDPLPFPARDTMEELVELGGRVTDARISTSRGCTFNCSFCVDPALGYRKKWRARSPKKVVDEIANLVERFGISFFWFSEDNFIPPTAEGWKRADKIAELLIQRDIEIGYRALLRADAIDGQPELLDKLARSGLKCVYLGIESGSPRRLAYFKKHETPDLYRRVIRQLHQFKIGVQVGFIMFDPLTTWEDLETDARFLYEIEEMYLYSNYCQVLDVFPGAQLTRILMDKGLLDRNFTYDSPVDEYRYDIPGIGKMAKVMQSAYKDDWIEIDKFFQRLRVIDLPRLWHMNADNSAAGFHEFQEMFSSAAAKVNKAGLDFFLDVLELSRGKWDEETFQNRLNAHYNFTVKEKDRLIEGLRQLPEDVKKVLSAAACFL